MLVLGLGVESGEVCLASGSRERGEHGGKNGFPSDRSVMHKQPACFSDSMDKRLVPSKEDW